MMQKILQKSKFYLSIAFLAAVLLLSCSIRMQDVDAASYPKLTVGKSVSRSYAQSSEDDQLTFTYTFTPDYTGAYSLDLEDYEDNCTGRLYTPSGELLSSSYNWDEDYSYYELTKGITYQYQVIVYTYCDSGTFTITPKSHISVSIQKDDTSSSTAVIAVGKKKTLSLENASFAKSKTWKSSKPTVATVNEKGVITAIKAGQTTITISGKDLYGSSFSDKFTIIVNNPKLSTTSLGLNIYQADRSNYDKRYYCDNNTITISGLKEYSSVSLTSSSKNLICEYYSWSHTIYLYPKKTGSYTVKATIDGKKFTIKVSVQKLYFARNSKTIADPEGDKWSKTWVSGQSMIALYKGETTTLSLKGKPAKSTVKYKSSNKAVATVTSAGKITAKGVGYTTITATVDGMSITYEVGVSYKTAILALRYAAKHYGDTYSQEKRMQEGYYDCSSYVWRSYAAAGKYLQTKNYAPTAADLGKWCNDNGYMILSGTVNMQKALPGDLIFWIGTKENGHVNGRYRNIYHVEMYQGMNRAITVNSQQYYPDTSYEIMIARPCDTSAEGLKVATSGKKKLKLTWSSEFGADGYQIYRSTSKNGKYTKVATVKNATTYTDSSLKSKQTYYYKVRAYWKSSEKTYYSKYSSVVSKKAS